MAWRRVIIQTVALTESNDTPPTSARENACLGKKFSEIISAKLILTKFFRYDNVKGIKRLCTQEL